MTSLPPEIVEADALSPSHVKACLNCGTPAPGNFCPECGQETARGPRPLAQYFRESIARIAAGRSRLWQSLSKLFFAPGALTVEYKAGRRARYLRPLQLYLMASVIVFAAVQLFGLSLGLRFIEEQGLHLLRNTPPVVDEVKGKGQLVTAMLGILDYVDTPGVRRFQALSLEDKFTFLRARRVVYVSYVLLLMVPIFALALALSYRDRRRRYAEHLVFGLHCQTYLLVMLLIESKLPPHRSQRIVVLGGRIFHRRSEARLRRHMGGNAGPRTDHVDLVLRHLLRCESSADRCASGALIPDEPLWPRRQRGHSFGITS